MLKKIFIYGASGHGKVVQDIALACAYTDITFIDDGDNAFLNFEDVKNQSNVDVIVAIGENLTRKKLIEKVEGFGFNLTTLIHPSAIVSQSASIDKGTVVMPYVVVNAGASVGKGVILNTGCIVEHECFIDNFVHLSPSVSLSGNVSIGKYTHIGINATVIQNILIGDNVIVGAGSVVLKNIENNAIVAGNPTRLLRYKNE